LIGLEATLGLTVTNGTWKGLDPEEALLGGILKQAIRDSRQLSDGKLRREAWQFLQNCAPVVETTPHTEQPKGGLQRQFGR
jgi:hypothetical protein